MVPTLHEPPAHCPNCRRAFAPEPRPRFCPHCGQETTLHAPTLGEFVHEFIGHYVALEGTLWRTLNALLLHPGRLTREYLAGRRRHYVPPLRLYLSASFLFFLLVKVVGVGAMVDVRAGPSPPAVAASGPLSVGPIDIDCEQASAHCNWFERQIDRAGRRIDSGATQPGEINRHLSAMAPYAGLMMLPLYAGVVALVYRRRRVAYGAHFVFSLHQHSLWFLVALAGTFTPDVGDALLLLYAAANGAWALHTVYGGRWWVTIARAGLITVLYLALFLASVITLVAAGLLWA